MDFVGIEPEVMTEMRQSGALRIKVRIPQPKAEPADVCPSLRGKLPNSDLIRKWLVVADLDSDH